MIALLLVDWDVLPLPLLYLSAYFERNRTRYNDLLLAVSQRAAWYEWVAFFLEAVAEQAHAASVSAKKLNDLHEEWRKHLSQSSRSNLSMRLVDYLFESPVLTVPEAERYLGVTYKSAKDAIERLVEAGVLSPTISKGRTKSFVAHGILQSLQDYE